MVRTRSVNGAGSTRKLANGQWAYFDDVFISSPAVRFVYDVAYQIFRKRYALRLKKTMSTIKHKKSYSIIPP